MPVGVADIFGGKAHHAPQNVKRVLPGGQHAAQRVKRCVRIASPHAFMQRRDQIVMLLSVLVIQKGFFQQRLLGGFRRDRSFLPGQRLDHRGGRLQVVEGRSGVAVGNPDDEL